MSVTIHDQDHCESTHATVLQALGAKRLFTITEEDDGSFTLTEGCDNHFQVRLTRIQLARLGHEILQLSNVADQD